MTLKAFAELFVTKMKPTKCPAKGEKKKNRARKEKEEGGQEKAKGKI